MEFLSWLDSAVEISFIFFSFSVDGKFQNDDFLYVFQCERELNSLQFSIRSLNFLHCLRNCRSKTCFEHFRSLFNFFATNSLDSTSKIACDFFCNPTCYCVHIKWFQRIDRYFLTLSLCPRSFWAVTKNIEAVGVEFAAVSEKTDHVPKHS